MPKLDVSLIKDLPPFAGMNQDDIQSMLDQAKSLRHEKGATIFRESEEAHSYFLLLDGHIRVVKINANGDQMIARYISSGELYGIARAIGRDTYPANAIAAVDCLSLSWPTSTWDRAIADNPGFAQSSYRTVGDRLADTQEQMIQLANSKVEQRVANSILKLASQTGTKSDQGILLGMPVSRQDIAEMTGTTLHTVSRIMSGWEDAGWIKSGRQKVVLIEGHKLMLVASGEA